MAADSIHISRVSTFDYFQDPEAVDSDYCRWQGERKFLSLEEIRADKDKYLNYERVEALASDYVVNSELSADAARSMQVTGRTDRRNLNEATYDVESVQPSTVKRVCGYEIYDRERNQMLLFAGGVGGSEVLMQIKSFGPTLKDEPDSDIPYIHGSPYEILKFNQTPDLFFGDSDYDVHESKYSAIDEISNRIQDYTKRMLAKFLVQKGAIGANDIQKIIRGKQAGVSEVEIMNGKSFNDIIYSLQGEPLKQENWMYLNFLRESHNADSGIAEFMRGNALKGKTATEMSMIGSGASSRAGSRQKAVDEFLLGIAQKMYYVMRNCYTEPRWIAVAGEYIVQQIGDNGESIFVFDDAGNPVKTKQQGFMLTSDLLESDLQISIEAGSTSLQNSIQKQQIYLNLFKTIGTSPTIKQDALIRKIFNSFGVDPDEILYSKEEMAKMQAAMAPPPGPNAPGQPVNPLEALIGGPKNEGGPLRSPFIEEGRVAGQAIQQAMPNASEVGGAKA